MVTGITLLVILLLCIIYRALFLALLVEATSAVGSSWLLVATTQTGLVIGAIVSVSLKRVVVNMVSQKNTLNSMLIMFARWSMK